MLYRPLIAAAAFAAFLSGCSYQPQPATSGPSSQAKPAQSQPAQSGPSVGEAIDASREAANRSQSTNNLRQLALAMHNHHDAKGTFPAGAVFKDGKPLLSWRVQLLPYLGAGALHQQFRLDEPWDSPQNKALIPQMPAAFRDPAGRVEAGKTPYLGVAGAGAFFDGQRGRKFLELVDGTSNTAMIVECNPDRAVVWTQPADWEFNAADPLAGLGNAHRQGFHLALGDGAVRFVASRVPPDTIKALVTVGGGEVVEF